MKNDDKILITSSDNIPYTEIEKHLGVVDSHIVIGANIFRDVFASYRDLFGGETKGYSKDIDKMKAAAFSRIESQVKERGGNAIISLRIDLDELSGGGKSMFMLNVYGSAVKLKDSMLQNEHDSYTVDEIPIEDVEYHKVRNRLRKRIDETDDIVREVSLNNISEYDLWDEKISINILRKSVEVIIDDLENHILNIPIRFIEQFLLGDIQKIRATYWDLLGNSLSKRNWFNYQLIDQLLRDESHIRRFRGLRLCTIRKDFYSIEDVEHLKQIGDFLNSEFDSSFPINEVSKMVGSKKFYTCAYCLKDEEVENYSNCQTNKFGLKSESPGSIAEQLMETAEAIETAIQSYSHNYSLS